MTTTLVTGGNGFIGRYLVRELLRRGRQVAVLDRTGTSPEDGATVVLGDIRDATAVNEAMAHADSWVHLAGVLGTQETVANPLPSAETNILGGLNVLQSAAQYKLPGVVIGVGNWFENNTYSLTKHTIERFAEMFRLYRGLPVSVVRALNAYGPGQSVAAPYGPSKVRKIMPSFCMRALHGDPIEVYGDGQQIMDMIYVADVAAILSSALDYTEEYGGSANVFSAGTGRSTTVLDIATEVIKAAGQGEVTHLPMRPGERAGAVVMGDPETLRPLMLDRSKFTPLEVGVPETVEWYRTQLAR